MEHIKDTLNQLNLRWIEFEFPIRLELTGLELMILIGHLILALRHPQNTGPSSDTAKAIGALLVSKLLEECPSAYQQKDLIDEWKQAFEIQKDFSEQTKS